MGKSEKRRFVQAPCKDCSARAVGCHGTCEKYSKYKEAKKQSEGVDPYWDYVRKRYIVPGRFLNGK